VLSRHARVAIAAAALVLGTSAASLSADAQGVGADRAGLAEDSLQKVPQRESWLGPDKVKHFFMAAFVESIAFGGLEAGGGSRKAALAGAIGTTVAISIGRELHDKRTKGLFSLGDLLWDAIGAAAAGEMLRHTQR
jgi:putative lipoprotein